MLATSGATGHAYVAALSRAATARRETVADIAHLLALLHGNRPSVFEIVAQSPLAPCPEWLQAATRGFAREREKIAQLVLAAGPPPARAGQTSVEMSVSATRNALATVAGSDRLGCAIGASAALLLDWDAISVVLGRLGHAVGIELSPRHGEWPGREASIAALEMAISLPGGDRAVRFGFQALLGQHHDFWTIVESRAG